MSKFHTESRNTKGEPSKNEDLINMLLKNSRLKVEAEQAQEEICAGVSANASSMIFPMQSFSGTAEIDLKSEPNVVDSHKNVTSKMSNKNNSSQPNRLAILEALREQRLEQSRKLSTQGQSNSKDIIDIENIPSPTKCDSNNSKDIGLGFDNETIKNTASLHVRETQKKIADRRSKIKKEIEMLTEKKSAKKGLNSSGTQLSKKTLYEKKTDHNLSKKKSSNPSDVVIIEDNDDSDGEVFKPNKKFTYDELSSDDSIDSKSKYDTISSASTSILGSAIELEEGEITDDSDNVEVKNKQFSIFVAGDKRARNILPSKWSVWFNCSTYINNSNDLGSFCHDISQRLKRDNEYNLVLLFAYHQQFIFESLQSVPGGNIELLKVNRSISVSKLMNISRMYTHRWQQLYPHVLFLWVLPYPIDFQAFNGKRMSKAGLDISSLAIVNDNEVFWKYIKEISTQWTTLMKNCYGFPSHHALFLSQREWNEFDDGRGFLPLNFLCDGLYPDEKFKLIFGGQLIRFLLDSFPFLEPHIGKIVSPPSTHFSNYGSLKSLPDCMNIVLESQRKLYNFYHQKPHKHPQFTKVMSWYAIDYPDIMAKSKCPPYAKYPLDRHVMVYFEKFLEKDFDSMWEKEVQKFTEECGSLAISKKPIGKLNDRSDNENKKVKDRRKSRSRSKSSRERSRSTQRYRKRKHYKKSHHHSRKSKKKHKKVKRVSSTDSESSDTVFEDENSDVEDLLQKERAMRNAKKCVDVPASENDTFSHTKIVSDLEASVLRQMASSLKNASFDKAISEAKHSTLEKSFAVMNVVPSFIGVSTDEKNVNSQPKSSSKSDIPKAVEIDWSEDKLNENTNDNSVKDCELDKSSEICADDIDIDNVVGDEDFWNELDKELDDVDDIPEVENPNDPKEENIEELKNVKKVYVVETLKMLKGIAHHLGSLSPAVFLMCEKAVELSSANKNPLSILTKSNKDILEVIVSNLDSLSVSNDTSSVDKAVFNVVRSELRDLISCSSDAEPNDDIAELNIKKIAKLTVGCNAELVMSRITNYLLYNGINPTDPNIISNIYMKVKVIHLKEAENDSI